MRKGPQSVFWQISFIRQEVGKNKEYTTRRPPPKDYVGLRTNRAGVPPRFFEQELQLTLSIVSQHEGGAQYAIRAIPPARGRW
jgi:hypothetical protein